MVKNPSGSLKKCSLQTNDVEKQSTCRKLVASLITSPMFHYRSLDEVSIPVSHLTVGVFDGVHRGHQEIIKKLVAGARTDGVPAVVLTFDPHPVKVFRRSDIKLLSLPGERAKLLGELGVDVVITHPFNKDVANITAADFMQKLKTTIGLKHMIAGYDFALGKDREGNASRLTEIGLALGYSVDVLPALSEDGGVITSTAIRKLIQQGSIQEAESLLGHPYSLQGIVSVGDRRGRTIGFPTANLDYASEKVMPAGGIYACYAHLGNEKYKAAVNLGTNPTFTPDKQSLNVEAYLLDFDQDIYGQMIKLEFVARLRDEIKYDSVEALIKQIELDVQQTRDILGTE